MSLETLTVKHLTALEASIEAQGVPVKLTDSAQQFLHSPYRWAFMDGEVVLGAGGLSEVLPGVAEVWAVVCSPIVNTQRRRKILDRCVRKALKNRPEKFHRLQAAVVSNFKPGLRWAEFYGFEKEGLMKSYYGVGKDAWRVALCQW